MTLGVVARGDLRSTMQNLQLMLQGPGAAKVKTGAKAKRGKVYWGLVVGGWVRRGKEE
jgi:hypothetical protein